MKPEISLSCSQEPAIGPYPEPGESNPHLLTLFSYHSNIKLLSNPMSSDWSLCFRFYN